MKKQSLKKFLHAPIAIMGHMYQKKYHLRYVHARKLFVFDIILLLGTILLIAATVFWHRYDPTIEDYVLLNVSVSDETGTPLSRIPSGALVRYTIAFENTSDSVMTRPQLRVQTPSYFTITDMDADSSVYDAETQTFTLPDIAPGNGDTLSLDGVYFGTPNVTEDVLVELTYIQDGRTVVESRHARIISTLRDAVLTGSLALADTIRGTGSYPLSITLTNDGQVTLTDITLPIAVTGGSVAWNDVATIATLDPNESVSLSGIFTGQIPRSETNATIAITPELLIEGDVVPQAAISTDVSVVHPAVSIGNLSWDQSAVSPGNTITLSGTVQNTGSSELTNVRVTIPTSNGIVAGNPINTTVAETLAPGASANVQIDVPIRAVPTGGTDLLLRLSPSVSADAPGGTTPVQSVAESPTVSVGTALRMRTESRYYTNEGDQLGRGPLPPTVGKETKYWALVTVENTTSRVTNAIFTATLGPGINWTGRSSVSLGNEPTYSAANNQVRWSWANIPANQTVGIYMELAITPTTGAIGTVPTLLENITISATDDFIGGSVSAFDASLSADLVNDARGRALGVSIE